MIPKNLKIGDTFTDGNRTFKVLAIKEYGYTSECIDTKPMEFITKADVKVEKKEEKITTENVNQLDSFNNYTKTEINRLSVSELEKVCAQLGLETSTGVEMKKAIIKKLGL